MLSSDLIFVMLSGLKVGFILHATGPKCEKKTNPFMRNVVKEAVETLGYEPGKFAVMARAEGQVHSMNFQDRFSKKHFLHNVMKAPTEAPWKALALEKCLKEMNQLFKQTDGEKVRAYYVNIISEPISQFMELRPNNACRCLERRLFCLITN